MRINKEIHKKLYDESDASFEARKLWYSFKEAVFYENRYFVKHKLLDILSMYMNDNILTIEPGKVYYRARIIDDSAINEHMVYKCFGAPDSKKLNIKYVGKANPFKGLSKEASFVPPKDVKVSEGRANAKFVKYLYVAESPTTAIFEVRPFIYDAINIAQIRVNESIKIANIAVELDYSNNENATMESHVMGTIQGAFAKPTNNPDDYIPTQIIAEYIRSLGYEGIRFNSSLHDRGVNLTIFNYEKCEAIASQDFRLENIKLTARAAFGSASYQGDLFFIKDNEPQYLDFENLPFFKTTPD